ncbi:DMT family transporter [Tabrizicola sp. J26]|uniref:DMT family transporter n=1 Tax=Alitabrizicola rongguiensis TaxID=2909234 RepID=UPI001F483BFF|nr:DMT family transporter [Tabrizicola rongguiensis]MCF1708616.1 DMT family transporter [Tabrizicola rongguiensis]
MSSETLRYALIMLLAGIGIPLLAALNSRLGASIGAPFAAASVLFVVAFAVATTAMILSGQARALAVLPEQPWYLFLGGLFVAFYVLSVTVVAPRFGVGNAVFCVLLGQMIAAATIDQFGLFGAVVRQVTLIRAVGLGTMALGLALIQLG